jgi:aflatoxin B1 aldehyde reductase
MPQQSAVNIVFGTGTFGKESQPGATALGDKLEIQRILDTFKAHGHNQLDTARIYVCHHKI